MSCPSTAVTVNVISMQMSGEIGCLDSHAALVNTAPLAPEGPIRGPRFTGNLESERQGPSLGSVDTN